MPPVSIPKEIAYVERLALRRWDAEGPFWPLHKLNALRVDYIRARLGEALGTDADTERPLAGLGDGLELVRRAGVRVNPFRRTFNYTGYMGLNYMMLLRRAEG